MNTLLDIKSDIEFQSKNHQIEILRILIENKVQINENNNGVFVNLTKVDEQIILKIKNYLKYIKEQNTTLDEIEKTKQNYKLTFFEDNPIEYKDKNLELV
tara:strand:- start:1762 stop:2061 length:300 start_codon:yes stop_codon:yes gene_type:complete